jgi:hypothetical protein
MRTVFAERSLGLLMAIAVTAAVLGGIGRIATTRQPAVLADCAPPAAARLAAHVEVQPEQEL